MHECMTGHRTARVGLIQLGEPAARQPGGRGARPPRCRVTGPQGPARKYFRKIFCTKASAAP